MLVTGHRFVPRGGAADEDEDAFEEHDEDVAEPVTALEEGAPGGDAGGTRKRRRGRRGGRGRRRPGQAPESTPPGDDG